jgi:hypothetical protein
LEYADIELVGGTMLPWMALGFREAKDCLMSPRGGNGKQKHLDISNGF